MKYYLQLFIVLLLGANCTAQLPFHWLQKAREHYKNEDYKNSVIYFDSLSNAPNLFDMTFGLIMQHAIEDSLKAELLIEEYAKSSVSSKDQISPFYRILQIQDCQNKEELIAFKNELYETINLAAGKNYYSAQFNTIGFFELQNKLQFSSSETQDWIDKLSRQNINTVAPNNGISAVKNYLRFIYAQQRYELGLNTLDDIFNVPCNPTDQAFIDRFIFNKFPDFFPNKFEYQKGIIEQMENGTTKENYGTQLVANHITDKNLNWLKSIYRNKDDIKKNWYNQSQKDWKQFNPGADINAYIDSVGNKGTWKIIDVWGTWCKPCVKELPHFVQMQKAFKKLNANPIEFITLCNDEPEKVSRFMGKNKYDFPVMIIGRPQLNQLEVDKYPTTFLISPDNKFVRLPGENKAFFIKAYTMLDW